MRELLTAAVRVGGVTHLVGPVTMVLQGGPRYTLNWFNLRLLPNYCSNFGVSKNFLSNKYFNIGRMH